MAKKKKLTPAQKRVKKLWVDCLREHIAGFISPRAGQNVKSLTVVDKAIKKGNLDAVSKEFNRLKKTEEGFLFPIFVNEPVKKSEKKKSTSPNHTKVGKELYTIPDRKLTKKLQKAWKKFATAVERAAD